MRALARGERPATPDAAAPSFDTVQVLIGLLTPETRNLLRVIRNERPESVADLARPARPVLRRTRPSLRPRLIEL